MEEKNNEKVNQPTAEQLKYWLDKAISDNKQLASRVRDLSDALNILPYLFKIVELKNEFDVEMVDKAKTAVKNILFSEQETAEKEGE